MAKAGHSHHGTAAAGNGNSDGHYVLLINDAQGGRDHRGNDDGADPRLTIFDRPLPFCGCGIGWCSCLLGFVFPLFWYYAAILFCRDYHRKDPRERAGLAMAATAALLFTIAASIAAIISLLILHRTPPT